MPRFLLPIVALLFVSLAAFGYVVFKLNPEQTASAVIFLSTLFASLTLALTLLFFSLHRKLFYRPQSFTALGPVVDEDELRTIYKKSLKVAVLLSATIIAALVYVKIK